jgi:hypothetical protein
MNVRLLSRPCHDRAGSEFGQVQVSALGLLAFPGLPGLQKS